MNLRNRLSKRLGLNDIRDVISRLYGDDAQKNRLFKLLLDPGEAFPAYQAGWVMTHWPLQDSHWLIQRQNALIDALFICPHEGTRRQIMTILYRQPLQEVDRVDLLDYCLQGIVSKSQAIAIQSLCIKIAYELCRSYPELLRELESALDLIRPDAPPAVAGARYNVLKAMKSGRSLQPLAVRNLQAAQQ